MHRRRLRHRPVSRRKQEERRRTVKRRLMIAAGAMLLAGLAMAPQLREHIAGVVQKTVETAQAMTLSGSADAQITLPKRTVYALQLGVYDNGKHAQDEYSRLSEDGIPAVIWQRGQMRLICDAAVSREKLTSGPSLGRDAFVISEEMPEVVLKVSTGTEELDAVRSLILLPDALFERLCAVPEELPRMIETAREAAQHAQHTHTDNATYTQLAQSLVNWCNLMDRTWNTYGEAAALRYARATMCTLCRELRLTLLSQSEASTASAQRTPSTEAEVMPPA